MATDLGTDGGNEAQPTDAPRYATFTLRFRALVVDMAVVLGATAVAVIGSDVAAGLPGAGRLAWLIMFAALFLYEPLLVWRCGRTIGHARNHLTVVDERSGTSPGFVRSFARYFIKLLLGLPSFVTMAVTQKRQAVHDMVSNTSVRLTADAPFDTVPADAPLDDIATDLEPTDGETVRRPSRLRRAAMMLVYLIATFVIYIVLLLALDPVGCHQSGGCSTARALLTHAVSLAWLVGSVLIIVAAWKGSLPGARRGAQVESVSLVV